MILDLFLMLVLVSLIMLIGGYFINAPVIQVMGCFLLFILGLTIMGGALQYNTGSIIDDTGLTTVVQNTYSNWNSTNSRTVFGDVKDYHTVGFYLTITSLLCFVAVMADIRGWGRSSD